MKKEEMSAEKLRNININLINLHKELTHINELYDNQEIQTIIEQLKKNLTKCQGEVKDFYKELIKCEERFRAKNKYKQISARVPEGLWDQFCDYAEDDTLMGISLSHIFREQLDRYIKSDNREYDYEEFEEDCKILVNLRVTQEQYKKINELAPKLRKSKTRIIEEIMWNYEGY